MPEDHLNKLHYSWWACFQRESILTDEKSEKKEGRSVWGIWSEVGERKPQTLATKWGGF